MSVEISKLKKSMWMKSLNWQSIMNFSGYEEMGRLYDFGARLKNAILENA